MLDLLLLRLLAQAWSLRGCWVTPALGNDIGSGLLWRMLFARDCSCGCPLLGPAPAEVVSSGLLPWMSLTQSYSRGGHWIGPAPEGVPGLGLLSWRSGCWPGPSPTEVSDLGLACACSSEGFCLGSALVVAGLGLLPWRLLFSLGPEGVAGSGPVLWRWLARAWPCLNNSACSVTGSGLFWWRSLLGT